MEILIPILAVTVIGLICAVGLAVASSVMAVKEDTRFTEIRACLPGANCGACGYTGCDGYAKALLEPGTKTNLCVPGADAVAAQIAALLGVEAERKEFTPWRTYKSKAVKYAKLKKDDDIVVTIAPIALDDVMVITHNGYALHFNIDEVPVVGAKAAGVKSINLKDDDFVVSAFIANTESFFILTQRGGLKRMATELIPATSRANRGLQVLRELKSKPHRVFMAGPVHASNDVQNIALFTIEPLESDKIETLEVYSNKGNH